MAPIPSSEYCVRAGAEFKTGAFWRDAFSELVATFLLVVAQIILLQNWNVLDPLASPNPVQVAVGMAFVAASVGYGLGDYGGAHMNPAVTLAMMIRAEICFLRGIVYWIMQVGGAIAAAFFVVVVTPENHVGLLGNTVLTDGVMWWQGLVIEALMTMMLCLAALGAQNVPRKGYIILPSLPIGFALGLGLFLGLPSTGGSLNPARSVGPAVAAFVLFPADASAAILEYHWIYWAGPMGGALLAAIIYWIFDSVDKPEAQVYGTNTWAYSGGRTPSKEALTPPNGDGGIYPRNMLNGL